MVAPVHHLVSVKREPKRRFGPRISNIIFLSDIIYLHLHQLPIVGLHAQPDLPRPVRALVLREVRALQPLEVHVRVEPLAQPSATSSHDSNGCPPESASRSRPGGGCTCRATGSSGCCPAACTSRCRRGGSVDFDYRLLRDLQLQLELQLASVTYLNYLNLLLVLTLTST